MPSDLTSFCKDQFPRLVGLLSLYCGDRGVAEEMAQETLARICRDWKKVKVMSNPEAWASKVAINLTNSFFRRRAAERRARQRAEAEPMANHPPDTAAAISVRNAISSLSRRHRTAIVLHYYADLTMVQVAEAMGVPEGTAKSWCRRGIERLRNELDEKTYEEVSRA